jgi:hypothetical protein
MPVKFLRSLAACLLLLPFSHAACAQERQWAFDSGDSEAFLIFGVPETDDVGVSFWCRKGSGQIQMFIPGTDPSLPPGKTRKFGIKVSGQTLTRRGLVASDELNGGTTIEAKLDERDPLFGLLLDADRFTVVSGPATHTYPMTDADLPSLLDACRKR